MQRVDYIRLSWIHAPKLELEEAQTRESERRVGLTNAIGLLRKQDDSNRDFTSCCTFVDRDTSDEKEICQFERCRALYLQSVLGHARSLFSGEMYPEESYFNHGKERLRAIDPDLVGESRCRADDWSVVKIYKIACCFLSRQLYSWMTDEISAWKTRCTVLEWGATQNPHTVMFPKTRDLGVDQCHESQFVPKTVCDHLIRDVFIQALGFKEEDVKSLQGILGLLPGEIKAQGYNPTTNEAQFTLDKKWVGRPNWEVIDKKSSDSVPKVIAPISLVVENLQSSGTAVPDILKTVGDRLAIVPRDARLEIAQTVKGTIKKASDGIAFSVQDGSMRLVIPARFGFFSPDIYIDITELKRLSSGQIEFRVKAGASTGFDTTMKGLALAITKLITGESSTTLSVPPNERLSLPHEGDLRKMKKHVTKYLQWGS